MPGLGDPAAGLTDGLPKTDDSYGCDDDVRQERDCGQNCEYPGSLPWIRGGAGRPKGKNCAADREEQVDRQEDAVRHDNGNTGVVNGRRLEGCVGAKDEAET